MLTASEQVASKITEYIYTQRLYPLKYRAQNEAVDGVMAGFWGKCF